MPTVPPWAERQQSVLVIDDDENLRDTIAMMLEQEGYKTEMASNGRTGLEQALTSKPDLVLVDAQTVAHAVVARPPRRLVVAGGRIVARNGELLPGVVSA